MLLKYAAALGSGTGPERESGRELSVGAATGDVDYLLSPNCALSKNKQFQN